jgi:4a-hydroxytetrahydrobiopterin dehydratase
MPVLGDEEIQERLGSLEGWERDGDALRKEFKLDDFVGSVEFMNHHPDLAISWNKVAVSLSTHSEGGITENDFELAKRIDSLA